ncbi:MAG: DinB family protein [Novosphingobium sp.]|nr:DinB family protein [Novosphingobium sp.]
MITDSYLRVVSRYNRWQNAALYDAAGTLDDIARRADRGAFWSSIHSTLSHLYWGDRMWLSRLGQAASPDCPLAGSGAFVEDWEDLCELRRALDDVIVSWADGFAPGIVEGQLEWFSGALNRDMEAPLGVTLHHVFNHQTHHRGQVHAMLTAAGVKTADTDLFLMPRELWPPS